MNYYVKQAANDCVFGPFRLEELRSFLDENIFHSNDQASMDRQVWTLLPQLIQGESNQMKEEPAVSAVSETSAAKIRLELVKAVQLRPAAMKKPAVVLPDSMQQSEPKRPRIVLARRDQ